MLKAKIIRYYYDDTRPTIKDYIECRVRTTNAQGKTYWQLIWRISYEDVNVHSKICPDTTFDTLEAFVSRIICLQMDGYKIEFDSEKVKEADVDE